jgi:hypothetical protein
MLESPGISNHLHSSTYSLPRALSVVSILGFWTCRLSVDGLWRWWLPCMFIKNIHTAFPLLLATTRNTEQNIVTKEHVKVFKRLASVCRIDGEQLKLIILCYYQRQWCIVSFRETSLADWRSVVSITRIFSILRRIPTFIALNVSVTLITYTSIHTSWYL